MLVMQVRDLAKEYEGRPLFDEVSFDLYTGERIGLIGANGCGKTTLMKMLAGELAAEQGTCFAPGERFSRSFFDRSVTGDRTIP